MSLCVQGPNEGIVLPVLDVRLTPHTAISIGDVVAMNASVQTVNSVAVPALYLTAAIADGTEVAASDNTGIIAVALEAIASGEVGLFRLRGLVNAAHDATVAIGGSLAPKTGALNLTAVVAGTKCVAQSVEARSGAGLALVMFDGINGFGFGI